MFSFICKLVLLLLFIPSKFSFFQHYWLLQLGLLNLYIMRSEYCSTLASIGTAFFVLFTGIWGNVVVSSVIVCLIISVSYALSANMYVGFITSYCSYCTYCKVCIVFFGPFVALWCLINIYCESTVIWFLDITSACFFLVLLL